MPRYRINKKKQRAEHKKRFLHDGCYDVERIIYFDKGVEIAQHAYKMGFDIPDPDALKDGMMWAIHNLWLRGTS